MPARALPKYAYALNWVLALLQLSGIVALFTLGPEFGAFRYILAAIGSLLLAGVLIASPIAYLCIATLAFIGLAGALRRADGLMILMNALVFGLALYIRSEIRSTSSQHAAEPENAGH